MDGGMTPIVLALGTTNAPSEDVSSSEGVCNFDARKKPDDMLPSGFVQSEKCSPGRIRTYDRPVNSRMLCH